MAHASHRPALSSTLGILILIAATLCLPSAASAHAIGLSRGIYQATPQGVNAELFLARAELEGAVPSLDGNRDGSIDAVELASARTELEAWLVLNLKLDVAKAPCVGSLEHAALSEPAGLSVQLSYACPAGNDTGDVSVTLDLLNQLAYGHRHVAHIVSGTTVRDQICFRSQASFTVPRFRARATLPETHAWSAALGFLRMGFGHVLSGYDHVAFLLALLLTAWHFRSLLLIVTAFTLGHSLSLGLVMFDVVSPPAGLIEPAIALSVAYVGAENIWRCQSNRESRDLRWRITLPFGLIHGFGFASALREVAIARVDLPIALLSFNFGVELGQLLILALCLPIVLYLRRSNQFAARVVPALSALVLAAGVVWFVARLGPLAPWRI